MPSAILLVTNHQILPGVGAIGYVFRLNQSGITPPSILMPRIHNQGEICAYITLTRPNHRQLPEALTQFIRHAVVLRRYV